MQVLIATDHIFLRYGSKVYDTYCFGEAFFTDYLDVFESVIVAARLSNTTHLPQGAHRSSNTEIQFLDIPDARGIRWMLGAPAYANGVIESAVSKSAAIIVRVPSQLGRIAATVALSQKKPYMVEVVGDPKQAIAHAGDSLLYRLVSFWEANRLRRVTDKAAVASYVSKSHLQAAYPVPNTIPSDSISSIRLPSEEITAPRDYHHAQKALRVAFVASLLPYKRHVDLINACKLVLKEGIDLEVHFVGDGPLRNELERTASELEIQQNIVFHGHIAERSTLLSVLDDCDLFAITSASEGLPRSVLEAMARGLPAIGSRAGGIPELIQGTELFNVGDISALAKLIVELANDPLRMSSLSEYSISTAKQHSSTNLSPRRQRLYQVLRELVERQNK